MNKKVQTLINHYKMIPLPVEGTLFSQSYKTDEGTAIIGLYCNEPYSVSLFHRLTVDEIWHFYGGDPLHLILLYPDGSARDVIMGTNPLEGQFVQFTVPAGVWQAGHVIDGGKYSLYGCTMAPGFSFDKFEGGTKSDLIKTYPEREKEIQLFGCNQNQLKMTDEEFN